ncbi:hypothetical protein BT63DRAFT_424772 [Microthyrium microscopicum]|uniref:Uncharacterized protein n=1 Tax=Microthyrium microscopicum TaxID=703497 RepID=A0A6A6UBQ6_9PEZI|nr:hypothetical protein BT63DRAFT_424772 [Microthyrium microscopicum]
MPPRDDEVDPFVARLEKTLGWLSEMRDEVYEGGDDSHDSDSAGASSDTVNELPGEDTEMAEKEDGMDVDLEAYMNLEYLAEVEAEPEKKKQDSVAMSPSESPKGQTLETFTQLPTGNRYIEDANNTEAETPFLTESMTFKPSNTPSRVASPPSPEQAQLDPAKASKQKHSNRARAVKRSVMNRSQNGNRGAGDS